jgi:transcriptional regulator with XRE-family HTH domain
MRELIGLTQDDFAEIVNIPRYRLASIETLRTQLSLKDIETITDVFPDFLSWLAVEGDITLADLKESQSKMCKAIAARIEAGLIPEGYFLEEKIK